MTVEIENNNEGNIEPLEVIEIIASLPEVLSNPVLVKTNKQINKEALDKLKNNNCCYCPKIDNSLLAKIQGRIARENNNFHRPIFNAINNK